MSGGVIHRFILIEEFVGDRCCYSISFFDVL